MLGAALLAGLYGYFLLKEEPVWVMAVIGAAGALISMAGDLAASAIKRNKGIKDYGKLIPGHGGIMDRFRQCNCHGTGGLFSFCAVVRVENRKKYAREVCVEMEYADEENCNIGFHRFHRNPDAGGCPPDR